MPSNAPGVQHGAGGRTAARKGEKIDHLASHVVFEYALDRSPSSITRSLNTMAMCVDFGPHLRSAPRRARVTHNNPKACFMLVLASGYGDLPAHARSPCRANGLFLPMPASCSNALYLDSESAARPSVQTWGKI